MNKSKYDIVYLKLCQNFRVSRYSTGISLPTFSSEDSKICNTGSGVHTTKTYIDYNVLVLKKRNG